MATPDADDGHTRRIGLRFWLGVDAVGGSSRAGKRKASREAGRFQSRAGKRKGSRQAGRFQGRAGKRKASREAGRFHDALLSAASLLL
jgi:hypothetical protein